MLTAKNVERAGDLLRMHGARNRLFGDHLFTPDAWDILLYLHTTDTPHSLDAIQSALGLAEDTARRWLTALESEELVSRDGSAFTLTDRARCDVETALAA